MSRQDPKYKIGDHIMVCDLRYGDYIAIVKNIHSAHGKWQYNGNIAENTVIKKLEK